MVGAAGFLLTTLRCKHPTFLSGWQPLAALCLDVLSDVPKLPAALCFHTHTRVVVREVMQRTWGRACASPGP